MFTLILTMKCNIFVHADVRSSAPGLSMAVSYFPWAYALLFTHIFFNPEGGCVFQPRVREALGATLGFRGKFRSTPKVLHPCPKNCIATINGRNPVGVDASGGSITQGCSKTREPWAGGRNTFGIQEHKKSGQRAWLTLPATYST